MIKHLASLADERLIISFAPYTPYYAVLKRIGELFPGPSKVPPLSPKPPPEKCRSTPGNSHRFPATICIHQ